MPSKLLLKTKILSLSLLGLILFASCEEQLLEVSKVEYVQLKVKDSLRIDSSINQTIEPYRLKMKDQMDVVVGHNSMDMEKAQPESTLGNFVAEVVLHQCKEYYDKPIDFSIVNFGGIRIPKLPEGPVTTRKVFELMPFDNFLVVMELDGKVLKQVFDHMASVGGWPIANACYIIGENEALEVIINGKSLKEDESYTLAVSDYLANGGDQLDMLKDRKREYLGVLFRDAIFDYIKDKENKGEQLEIITDERVKHATAEVY